MKYSKMGAALSPCGRWRYSLTRVWDEKKPTLCVVGLNPSTADELVDDPTLRRCVGFASTWGYGSLVLVNVYAYRATEPSVLRMLDRATRIGPDNAEHIRKAILGRTVLAAWGGWGGMLDADWLDQVRGMLKWSKQLLALGLTANRQPRHPLYVRADTCPVLWC